MITPRFPVLLIQENTATDSIPFIVGDFETPVGSLLVSAVSSNTTLILNSKIVISGSGANRSLVITPSANQTGLATIIVTVNDGTLTSQQTFQVTVQAVETPAVITLNPQPLVFHVSAKKVVALDGNALISASVGPALSFAGSVLQVSGHATMDTLSILKQGGISRKGKNVVIGKTAIGTLTGGKKGAALSVHLNGAATQNSVQLLLRSIGFKSTDKIGGIRALHIQITNIEGGNTNQGTRQIQVGM
jgi:hypothetical protein